MKRWFLDPRGRRYEIKDCLQKGFLSEYYPLPYLQMAAEERPWTGQPSTTQLINGARMEYLKLTTDYAVDPSELSFAILGTCSHKKLEELGAQLKARVLTEKNLCEDDITGIADLLERQVNGDWWMVDYKTWGSVRLSRALGLVKRAKLLTRAGRPVLLKSGPNKGAPKTGIHYVRDPDAADMEDVTWQLNRYRLLAEPILKAPIKAQKAFVLVRDAGTFMARRFGITLKTYYLDVPYREEGIVQAYFDFKKKLLLDAMAAKKVPERCSDHENWGGLRCRGYCPVAAACRTLGDNPHLKRVEESFEEEACPSSS